MFDHCVSDKVNVDILPLMTQMSTRPNTFCEIDVDFGSISQMSTEPSKKERNADLRSLRINRTESSESGKMSVCRLRHTKPR